MDPTSELDSDRLRQQLMAPDPMQRAIALHALEVEVERSAAAARGSLAQEVESSRAGASRSTRCPTRTFATGSARRSRTGSACSRSTR